MRLQPGYLETYSRTMQRVYWAEFIDGQLRPNQGRRFRASIVGNPFVLDGPDSAGEPDATFTPETRLPQSYTAAPSSGV